MKKDIIGLLTSKNNKEACCCVEKIISDSKSSNQWYEYFDDVASLLNHESSLVRNRAIGILSANAKWDKKNKFNEIIDNYLLHVVDDKPITSRQCIKSLKEIVDAKPELIEKILKVLQTAELSKYKDSMKPLIEKDILEIVSYIKKFADRER